MCGADRCSTHGDQPGSFHGRHHVPFGGLLITERDMGGALTRVRRLYVPFGGRPSPTGTSRRAHSCSGAIMSVRGTARRRDSQQEASSHVRRRSLLRARRSARIGIVVGQATLACPLAFAAAMSRSVGQLVCQPTRRVAPAGPRPLRTEATAATIVTARYTRPRPPVFRRRHVPSGGLLTTERDISARLLAFRRRHVPFGELPIVERDAMACLLEVAASRPVGETAARQPARGE
ncbi:hypothetical protein NONI108955_15380 [Nocardia ninae]